jgi:aspartyl-tRNA(Asn)/glutamyl-tRNA(Gln) amidotransferase subunit B|uniref:Aspartyl/glutamyl-tRNA(Asn/Gln) amidotransferase subunit B n=1 Tax=candidate division WOR-3 bacterium TaxID=2052148 RepID=A0A7C3YTI0_UNCW3
MKICSDYETVIGLEVHIQLNTKTKLFCSCSVEFGEKPNTNVCPVCLGFPGVLPVLNDNAVHLAIKAALALNCSIQSISTFARKHYFYPDLPKGYQITQYEKPLAKNGFLMVGDKKIRIRRLHLEEDAGKLLHTPNATLIDFNRCGVPLVEVVTEPDISSPEEAVAFLSELRNILRYLEVSSGDMEKGHLRCEPNISLKKGNILGTRREIKNLNSLKSVREALNYEIATQRAILESGGKIVQKTLLWDEAEKKTLPMREKEEAEDYRYFPEPDLPPLVIREEEIEEIKKTIPELPGEKKKRFVASYSLSEKEAEILIREKALADYYEEVIAHGEKPTTEFYKLSASWIINEVGRILNEENIPITQFKISPPQLAQLLNFLKEGKITQRAAKDVFFKMAREGKSAKEIIEREGLEKKVDEQELEITVKEVLKENPEVISSYKKGKTTVIEFLLGQVMKKTKGRFPPNQVREKILENLKSHTEC